MVHLHLFRSAFQSGMREHRLLGMAGETPFTNAAEINAESTRVETRLNTDADDVSVQAELRVTKIRLELAEANPALQAAARAAIDRLTTAERTRRDLRAEVTTTRGTQTAKRAELLAALNAPATRAATLTAARTEINLSLAAIADLSNPATPAGQKMTRGDLIAAHLEHIRLIEDVTTVPPLNALEKATLRTSLATETAATDPSKDRLGREYLKAEGYSEVAPVAPMLRELKFDKVFPGVAPAADRTLNLKFVLNPAAPPAAQMWIVSGNIGGVALAATDVAAFNPAGIEGLIAASAPANPHFGAVAAATESRRELVRQFAIIDNMKNGVQTPVPATLNIVRNKVIESEATRTNSALAALTTAHNAFIAGDFETAYLSAKAIKDAGASSPEILRTRILADLDSPLGGLRKVAADKKDDLNAQIRTMISTIGVDPPSNAREQVTELRRQITDIDTQLKQREVQLGVATAPATAPTAPTTAPTETPEARTFKTAVDAAINPLSATSTRAQLDAAQTALGAALTTLPEPQRAANLNYLREKATAKGLTATITGTAVRLEVTAATGPIRPETASTGPNRLMAQLRPFLDFLRALAPVFGMINSNFNPANFNAVMDRVDAQLALRGARQELAEFDRLHPNTATLTAAERTQRTGLQTAITNLEAQIARMPVPTNAGTNIANELSEADLSRFAASSAAALNNFLGAGTTSVLNNRILLINCAGKPAAVLARLNMLSTRFESAKVPRTAAAGIPENANQPGSNVIALDARIVFNLVRGNVNSIFQQGPDAYAAAPVVAPIAPIAPVTGPVVQATANASIGAPPKPTVGASSRRAV